MFFGRHRRHVPIAAGCGSRLSIIAVTLFSGVLGRVWGRCRFAGSDATGRAHPETTSAFRSASFVRIDTSLASPYIYPSWIHPKREPIDGGRRATASRKRRRTVPLTPAVFHILLALADGRTARVRPSWARVGRLTDGGNPGSAPARCTGRSSTSLSNGALNRGSPPNAPTPAPSRTTNGGVTTTGLTASVGVSSGAEARPARGRWCEPRRLGGVSPRGRDSPNAWGMA